MAVAALLAPLLGTWRGSGEGGFPTMQPFAFEEELHFEDVGTRDLLYLQRGWDPATGQTLHAEAGIWRVTDDGALTVTIAQPRTAEVSEGTIANGVVELASTSVGRATPPSRLVAVRRRYTVAGDSLEYEMGMATESVATITRHLRGRLQRVSG